MAATNYDYNIKKNRLFEFKKTVLCVLKYKREGKKNKDIMNLCSIKDTSVVSRIWLKNKDNKYL